MDRQDTSSAAGANNNGNGTNRQPTRHPILDRLENNDYDFNGQSLDYEPNLEFDDTDLKQEIEEELEQLNANLMLNLRFQREVANSDNIATKQANGDQTNAETSSTLSDNAAQSADTLINNQSVVVDNDIFLEHLKNQLYLQQQHQEYTGGCSPVYLESPHDLMEENFEEAFKSSLFELEDQQQRQSATNNSKLPKLLGDERQRTRNGKLNSFLKSATGGFYATKQNLLDDSLEELKFDDDFKNDDFSDIAKHNCVEVAGDDLFGRRIITIYACRLPSETKIHHIRLLKYIMYTLDQYVENDYCVVYFHYGLNSQNKPKLNFLYQAYKAFDRKYKKNLKALFLVHPTNFIRIVWQLFKPIIRLVVSCLR